MRTTKLFINHEHKMKVVATLRLYGIVQAYIDYDGCGDSGSVSDEAVYRTASGDMAADPTWTLPYAYKVGSGVSDDVQPIDTAMRDMCYAAIDVEMIDFVNNDGGYGTFYIKFGQESVEIKLEHEQRISSTESSNHYFEE